MPWTELHEAARSGCVDDARRLLARNGKAAAWVKALNPVFQDQTPLHVAAARGHAGIMQLLLDAAPGAALSKDSNGQLPLHHAAGAEEPSVEVVQALLATAPGSAAAVDALGNTPLHLAARHSGHVGVMQLLLADSPGSAAALDAYGQLPLHLAARAGQAAGVRVLLTAGPEAAKAVTSHGLSPLACAAALPGNLPGRTGALQLLLLAAPGMATAVDEHGSTPLHIAAQCSCAEVIAPLLAAAPEAAFMADAWGRLPLQLALRRQDHTNALATARCLLTAGSAEKLLPVLISAGERARPLFATLATRLLLSVEQWQLVPAGCPGLGSALPAVLTHSEQEAGQLVQHLSEADRQRLRTFALALSRRQQQLRVHLPQAVVQHILSLFDS